MIDANRAFREYATRVSFNMTLSRNQIYALRCVMLEQEMAAATFDERSRATSDLRRTGYPAGGNEFYHDNYVTGVRKLISMGLAENTPEWTADEKRCEEAKARGGRAIKQYWGPSLQFTPAGRHVIELLRIAGLIPAAVANSNSKVVKMRKVKA